MTLSYENIFSSFLGNITDYDFIRMDVTDTTILMVEKLHSVLAKPYIRRLFSSVSMDDEIQLITFEMDYVKDEESDKEFVIELLSKGMVVEWLQPQVKSKVNISQMFGTKESKWFSQSQHISEIRAMLEDIKLEVRKLIRDRGYINNDYLDGK